jgi:23S rRNA pseudouridine1911/1915/1917 synthase
VLSPDEAMNSPATQYLLAEIPLELAGCRLDQALAQMFNDYSRTTLKEWILAGKVHIDTKTAQPKTLVLGGEKVEVRVDLPNNEEWHAEAIALTIVYEDDDLIILDKPAGLVVHPGAGNPGSTLLNALLHYAPELASLPRAGIVHRIDKDTTGLLAIARSLRAHTQLVRQLQARTMKREYQAIVTGVMISGGTIEAPIGRHPQDRIRMAVVNSGKEAVTHYRVVQRFRGHSHIQVNLETGRTHQIRVHMAHIRYPIVGDPVYGGRLRMPPQASQELHTALQQFQRQALHASRLSLEHPGTKELLAWHSSLPQDMLQLIETLRKDADTD